MKNFYGAILPGIYIPEELMIVYFEFKLLCYFKYYVKFIFLTGYEKIVAYLNDYLFIIYLG